MIVPSCGRPSLDRVVLSILPQLLPEDELIVVSWRPPVKSHPQMKWVHFENGGYDATTGASLNREPGYPSGGPERDAGRAAAKGTHIMGIDDDDLFLPDALARGRAAAEAQPTAWHIFRMVYGVNGQWISPEATKLPNGQVVLWGQKQEVLIGNIGGSMYCMPNDPRLKWDRSAPGGTQNISEDFWVMYNYWKLTGCPVVFHPEVISVIKPTAQQIKDLIGVDVPNLRYVRQFDIWDGVPR